MSELIGLLLPVFSIASGAFLLAPILFYAAPFLAFFVFMSNLTPTVITVPDFSPVALPHTLILSHSYTFSNDPLTQYLRSQNFPLSLRAGRSPSTLLRMVSLSNHNPINEVATAPSGPRNDATVDQQLSTRNSNAYWRSLLSALSPYTLEAVNYLAATNLPLPYVISKEILSNRAPPSVIPAPTWGEASTHWVGHAGIQSFSPLPANISHPALSTQHSALFKRTEVLSNRAPPRAPPASEARPQGGPPNEVSL